MSDPRIALVAEGPTDQVIIEAALKAILPSPFVLTLLQPEATRPDLGGGWGGVLKWCRDFQARGHGSIEDDPTLEFYDWVVIHLDADVADKSYADCGPALEQEAQRMGWGALPCSLACPPPAATVNNLIAVLLSWLDMPVTGNKTILCIPSKSSEAWLAAAAFPSNQNLLQDYRMRHEHGKSVSPVVENTTHQKKQTRVSVSRGHDNRKLGWGTPTLFSGRRFSP